MHPSVNLDPRHYWSTRKSNSAGRGELPRVSLAHWSEGQRRSPRAAPPPSLEAPEFHRVPVSLWPRSRVRDRLLQAPQGSCHHFSAAEPTAPLPSVIGMAARGRYDCPMGYPFLFRHLSPIRAQYRMHRHQWEPTEAREPRRLQSGRMSRRRLVSRRRLWREGAQLCLISWKVEGAWYHAHGAT